MVIAGTGVGGIDYDLVEVYGNASLAVELDIILLRGFEAELGNYFDVLTTTGSLAIGGLEVTGHAPTRSSAGGIIKQWAKDLA